MSKLFNMGLALASVGQTCFIISFVFLAAFYVLSPVFGIYLPIIGVALNVIGAIFMSRAYWKSLKTK